MNIYGLVYHVHGVIRRPFYITGYSHPAYMYGMWYMDEFPNMHPDLLACFWMGIP